MPDWEVVAVERLVGRAGGARSSVVLVLLVLVLVLVLGIETPLGGDV